MKDQYLSPCQTSEICKGCPLKRACVTKNTVPNCVRQFMDGSKIKDAVLKSGGAPAEQTGNTGSPKLAAMCVDCKLREICANSVEPGGDNCIEARSQLRASA